VDTPHQREQEPDRELGNRMRRVGRHAHHGDAVRLRGGEIDVVETRAAQGDQPRPPAREHLDDRGVCVVVDEQADGRRTLCKRSGLPVQPRLEPAHLEAFRTGLLEALPVVRFGAEHRHAHLRRLPRSFGWCEPCTHRAGLASGLARA
jgi:hypothetical protein